MYAHDTTSFMRPTPSTSTTSSARYSHRPHHVTFSRPLPGGTARQVGKHQRHHPRLQASKGIQSYCCTARLFAYSSRTTPTYCQSTLHVAVNRRNIHRLSPVCTAASRSITSLQKNSKGQRTFNAHNPGRSTRSTLRRPGSSHSTPPTPSAATLFGRLLHMIMGEQDTLRNVTTLEFMS